MKLNTKKKLSILVNANKVLHQKIMNHQKKKNTFSTLLGFLIARSFKSFSKIRHLQWRAHIIMSILFHLPKTPTKKSFNIFFFSLKWDLANSQRILCIEISRKNCSSSKRKYLYSVQQMNYHKLHHNKGKRSYLI